MLEISAAELLERVELATGQLAKLSQQWNFITARDLPVGLAASMRMTGVSGAIANNDASNLRMALTQLEEAIGAAWRAASVTGDVVNAAQQQVQRASGTQLTIRY